MDKRIILAQAKSHGLLVDQESVKFLENAVSKKDGKNTKQQYIKEVFENINKTLRMSLLKYISSLFIGYLYKVKNGIVDISTLKTSIETLAKDDESSPSDTIHDNNSTFFKVTDAFKYECYKYASSFKRFELDTRSRSLFASSKDKSEAFRQRYYLIQQRLMRHPRFSTESFNQNRVKLHTIESLLGTKGLKYCLGMITQLEEGKFYLEDLKSSMALDFSKFDLKNSTEIVTEGCIVIVEGEVQNELDSFLVHNIISPPVESRQKTVNTFTTADFFCVNLDEKTLDTILEYEKSPESENDTIAVISDIWLDEISTFTRLNKVFLGFLQSGSKVPIAVILMGNFISPPNSIHVNLYIDAFSRLGKLWSETLFNKTKLIIVPGPLDPSPIKDILPKPAISNVIQKAFYSQLPGISKSAEVFPDIYFTTNPTFVRYCSKQIVIFREDIVNRLKRHSILKVTNLSTNADTLAQNVVRTLLDQGHLCPLSQNTKPIYWDFDYSLRIYPIPHCLILADTFETYITEYEDCKAFNPGSFSIDTTFTIYSPSTDEAEMYQHD